jgi:hypothetical protein
VAWLSEGLSVSGSGSMAAVGRRYAAEQHGGPGLELLRACGGPREDGSRKLCGVGDGARTTADAFGS